MNINDTEIIGKNVKDMYGTFMGNIVGTITNISGLPEVLGIDCGSEGLKQIPYEQLVFRDDMAIFIPKWRLDSQRFLKEKDLTLKKLHAMLETVKMEGSHEDVKSIYNTYKEQLDSLDSRDQQIQIDLNNRLLELKSQLELVKRFNFDAKVQIKSEEITQNTFTLIQRHTNDLMEHIMHETKEIKNAQEKLVELNKNAQEIYSYNDEVNSESFDDIQATQSKLPTPEISELSIPKNSSEITCNLPIPESENNDPDDKKDNDWLSRMEAQ